MSLFRSYKSILDPYQFFRFLKELIVRSIRQYFELFQHQDASEILSIIICDQCSESVNILNLLENQFRDNNTCSVCFQITEKEEALTLLLLAVSNYVQSFLKCVLNSEHLTAENKFFCDFCSKLQSCLIDHAIIETGHYMITYFKRFLSYQRFCLKRCSKC